MAMVMSPALGIAAAPMDASTAVEDATAVYYGIRIWGAPAALINFTILGWLLGVQRAGTTLLLQLLLNGTNILLDLLFVVGFGWGIAGVAAATVIAEVLAAAVGLALIFVIIKRQGGSWDWRRLRQRDRLVALLRVNADIFVRTISLLLAFGYFTVQGARMGDILLAANAILMNLLFFIAYGLDGFAHAAEILVGSAVGAANRKDFRQAVKVSSLWALVTGLGFSLVFLLSGEAIVSLYSDIAPVREAALVYLPWVIAAPLLSVWCFLLDGIFIGATRTAAMRNAMLISLGFFLAACWFLVPTFGNHGLWLALMIFMVGRGITLGYFYPALERSVGPVTTSK